MPIIKTEAFVLKSFRYGESSRIATLITKDSGKMSVIAKGIRSHKSKLSGTIELMNHISAVIYYKDSRELQYISKAELINTYSDMLKDIGKLSCAFRIMEFINRSVSHQSTDHSLFELLIKVFCNLDKADRNYDLHALYFMLEMARILGLFPSVDEFRVYKETFYARNEFGLNETLFDILFRVNNYSINDLCSSAITEENISSLINWFEKYVGDNLEGYRTSRSAKVFKELI